MATHAETYFETATATWCALPCVVRLHAGLRGPSRECANWSHFIFHHRNKGNYGRGGALTGFQCFRCIVHTPADGGANLDPAGGLISTNRPTIQNRPAALLRQSLHRRSEGRDRWRLFVFGHPADFNKKPAARVGPIRWPIRSTFPFRGRGE